MNRVAFSFVSECLRKNAITPVTRGNPRHQVYGIASLHLDSLIVLAENKPTIYKFKKSIPLVRRKDPCRLILPYLVQAGGPFSERRATWGASSHARWRHRPSTSSLRSNNRSRVSQTPAWSAGIVPPSLARSSCRLFGLSYSRPFSHLA